MSEANERIYRIYGSQASLYSGKARSYLRKKKIPFEERQTSHPHFQSVVVAKAGGTFQPTLEAPDGTVVRDTTEIIDFIESRHPSPSVYPTGKMQKLVALLFELFGDEGLLKAAMHYRWHFPEQNEEWILRQFSRFSNATSTLSARRQAEQIVEGMHAFILPGLGVTPATAPANTPTVATLKPICFKPAKNIEGVAGSLSRRRPGRSDADRGRIRRRRSTAHGVLQTGRSGIRQGVGHLASRRPGLCLALPGRAARACLH